MPRDRTKLLTLVTIGLIGSPHARTGRCAEAAGAKPDYPTIIRSIAEAQQREDEAGVAKLAQQAIKLLGSRAGAPDEPEEYRKAPARVQLLSPPELEEAFKPYHEHILRTKWWRIGDDPSRAEHALRDTASVVVGCLHARDAGCKQGENLLSLANDAADYLLWAQEQSGKGLFPFPAGGKGQDRAFLAADRFLRKAEQAGRLDDVVHQGWLVDDLGDGGLQFDNGLCGAAMVQLYHATQDEKHLQSARRAAEWAIEQPVVPNWNYNSFSVYLLAELARATGDKQLLEAAVKKARLGIYPGQLTDGPRKGRWFDGHNARLPYHYILVRSLVSLASALDEGSAERREATNVLLLALQARNKDFAARGVANTDSAFEALLLLEQRFPQSTRTIGPGEQSEASKVLETYCVAKFRAKSPPVAPAVWGLYLNVARGREAER